MAYKKLRPEDIKYEPIRQEKKPFWIHSVERIDLNHKKKTDNMIIVFSTVVLIGFMIFKLLSK